MTDTTLEPELRPGERKSRPQDSAAPRSLEGAMLVRQAAVLGAGVMGAQIAAHLANANVKPILFELAADGKDRSANARKAIEGLGKLEPSPLATRSVLQQIVPANYDEHLHLLADCDLVIEAISERMDWKKALFAKVAPHIAPRAIFASNTSGLSITELAKTLPAPLARRFCGIHFFNPPRYMRLVEMVPTPDTDPAVLDRLESFLTTTLGKGVIRAKDTPNFVANRVGVFSMLATMHHTAAFKLGFDEVDALTGPAIGRAKSATYRTADVVGLDTLAHVIKTMADTLPGDPWAAHYTRARMARRAGGQGGARAEDQGRHLREDAARTSTCWTSRAGTTGRRAARSPTRCRRSSRKRIPAQQLAKLRACPHPQAQFLWAILRDLFHYCAVHLAEIAHCARDVDFAIRWGFGWQRGPFELWQAAGWQQVAKWIAEDIAAGKAMAKAPLPAWVTDGRRACTAPGLVLRGGRHDARPLEAARVRAAALPRAGAGGEGRRNAGRPIFEDEGVRMWHQGDGIAIVSFKSKMHALGVEVLRRIESRARRGREAASTRW